MYEPVSHAVASRLATLVCMVVAFCACSDDERRTSRIDRERDAMAAEVYDDSGQTTGDVLDDTSDPGEVREDVSEDSGRDTLDVEPETTLDVEPETTLDAEPETTLDVEPETMLDVEPETMLDVDADLDTSADTDASPDPDTVESADTDTSTSADTDTSTNTDTSPDTDTSADTDTSPDTDTSADTDTSTNTDTSTDADTALPDTAPPADTEQPPDTAPPADSEPPPDTAPPPDTTPPDTAPPPDSEPADSGPDTAPPTDTSGADGETPECTTAADCLGRVTPTECEPAICDDGTCALALDHAACDDADPCTADTCVVGSGCAHTLDLLLCTAAAWTTTLDALGHPLGEVHVVESGPLGVRTAFTDPDSGAITLGQEPGPHVWRFELQGHVSILRAATLVHGLTVLPSPRLTPFAAPSALLPGEPVTLETPNGDVVVDFDADAFPEAGYGSVTPLDGQSLPAPLPLGWSPLVAFVLGLDVTPETPGQATLTFDGAILPTERAALVRLDDGTLNWRVLTLLGAAQGSVDTELPDAGAYALVVADEGLDAPADPIPDHALAASALSPPLGASLTATGLVTPSRVLASEVPEAVTAAAEVTLVSDTPLPSGVVLGLHLSEDYTLAGQRQLTPAPWRASLVAHRADPLADDEAIARFSLRPSLLFSARELSFATLTARVFAELPAPGGALVGPAGGSTTAGPLTLGAAPGAFTSAHLLALRQLEPDALHALLPAGHTVAHAFEVDTSGLIPGARLTLDLPALPPGPYLLVRLVATSSLRGLAPVERLFADEAGLLSSLEPAAGPRLPGITSSGTYALVALSEPQALVTGHAQTLAGAPAAGLAARVLGQPWLAQTAHDGAFTLVAPTGVHEVFVQDPATRDAGVAPASLADPADVADVLVIIGPAGPRVVVVEPADGALGVSPSSALRVTFSEPVSVPPVPLTLTPSGGSPVAGKTRLGLDGTTLTLSPEQALAWNTSYTMDVAAAVTDLGGAPLEGPTSFTFTTRAQAAVTTAGGQLISWAPGSTSHGCTEVPGFDPADTSIVCVVGTQGAADANVPVVLVNVTTAATATVLSKADGRFAGFVAAAEDDLIEAVFVNANATTTTLSLARQLYDDGSVGLFSAGGTIEAASPHGPILMAIPPGAIEGRMKLAMRTLDAAAIAEANRGTLPEGGLIVGAVRVTTDGQELQEAAEFVIPIAAAALGLPAEVAPAEMGFVVAVPREVEGVTAYQVIDRLHFEDGKLVTRSFPFLGFVATALLGVAKDVALDFTLVFYMTALRPVTTSGGVYECTSPCTLAESRVLSIMGFAAPTNRMRALPGAIVSARGTSGGSIEHVTTGRPQPGDMMSVTDRYGRFALLLDIKPPAPDDPTFGGYDWILAAIHPDYPIPTTRSLTTTDVVFELGAARADLVFQLGGPTYKPPTLGIQHSPQAPKPYPELGTGGAEPTSEQVAVVTATARHPSEVPRFEDPQVVQALALGSGDNVADKVVIRAGLPQYQRFEVLSAVPARVVLRISASTGGRSTTQLYPIEFGAAPQVVENPKPSPEPSDGAGPLVVWTWPPEDARGLDTGAPIKIRFNEPIDGAVAKASGPIQIAPESAGAASASLSPDQRELTLAFPSLAPDTEYTLTITSGVQDLRGNALDQDPLTPGADSFSLKFRTAPRPSGTLTGIGSAASSVVRGIYAYVLDRAGPLDGALVVYDLSDPSEPVVAATLSLPGYPRDLALIPRYSFKRRLDGEVETKDLLAIVGGKVAPSTLCGLTASDGTCQGSEGFFGVGQYLWVVDISKPAAPLPLAATVVSLDGNAVVPKITWSPPQLAYLEKSISFDTVNIVDLQTFILGMNLPNDQWRFMPDYEDSFGTDANGDGDYVDEGDVMPWPPQPRGGIVALGFAGKNNVVRHRDTTQPIRDFAYDAPREYVGALLGDGWLIDPQTGLPNANDPSQAVAQAYRTLMHLGIEGEDALPRATAAWSIPEGQGKRMLFLPHYAARLATGLRVVDLALLALTPNLIQLLDVTDPTAVKGLVYDPSAPQSEPIVIHIAPEHGFVQSLSLGDDGLLRLATAKDVLLLDPALLTQPAGEDLSHPAIVGVIPGAGTGMQTLGYDDSGLHLATELQKKTVLQMPPRLRFVHFEGAGGPVAPSGWSELDQEERRAAVAQTLTHMRTSSALGLGRVRAAGQDWPSTLTPPDRAVHHHVYVSAPGSAGSSILLGLESLDRSGRPYRSRGQGFAPVRALSAESSEALQPQRGCDAPVRPLKAWRLSDDPTSEHYNRYLSEPFVLVGERLTAAELAGLRDDGRELLWGGHFVRAFIDPEEDSKVLVPFRSEVDPDTGELHLGAAAIVEATAAEYVRGPNPRPVTGGEKLPGSQQTLSALNAQVSIQAADIALPSPVMPLVLERSIEGQDLSDGPFGRGWDFNYGQRLVLLADVPTPKAEVVLVDRGDPDDSEVARPGDLLFHTGGGTTIHYRRHPDRDPPPEYASDVLLVEEPPEGLGWAASVTDWYLPEAGVFDALVRFESGQYARLTPDGTQFWYGVSGRLEKIFHRYPANHHRLSYNGRGQLVRVTDHSVGEPRYLDFGWYRRPADPAFRQGLDEATGDPWKVGRIRRVRDSTGRDVLYSYDADGRLERFEGPIIGASAETQVDGGFSGRRATHYRWDACEGGASLVGVIDGSDTGEPLFMASQRAGANRDRVEGASSATGALTIEVGHDNTAAAIATGDGMTSWRTADGAEGRLTFDARGLPAAMTLSGYGAPDRRYESVYDRELRLVRTRLPRGNEVRYRYDADNASLRSRGNLLEIVRDPGDAGLPTDVPLTATFAYDGRYNQPSGTQVDFADRQWDIGLQDDGRSVGTIDVLASGLRTEWDVDDETGWLRGIRDANGVVQEILYDGATGFVRLVRAGGGDGAATTYHYEGCGGGRRGLPCMVQPALGGIIARSYDESDLLVAERRAGWEQTWARDHNGRPIRVRQRVDGDPPRELVELREYDAAGFLEARTLEQIETDGTTLDLVTDFVPDALKRLVEIRHHGGEVEKVVYDHLGQVMTRSLGPDGEPVASTHLVVEHAYDANGNRVETRVGGATGVSLFDGHDREVKVTDPLGGVVERSYDASGWVTGTRIADPLRGVLADLSREVDALGRPTRIEIARTSGPPSVTSLEYHRFGDAVLARNVSGPRGAVRTSFYDDAGRITHIVEEGVRDETRVIDDAFRLVEVVAREGELGGQLDFGARFAYDDRDHLITVRDSLDALQVQLAPRLDGIVEAVTDALGHRTETPHSLLGEPLAQHLPTGVSFAFERHDQRLPSFEGDGTGQGNRHVYDSALRLTRTQHRHGEVTTFGDFDARGRPRQIGLPGASLWVGYDALGRPVSWTWAAAASDRSETRSYDALGRVRAATFPDGERSVDYDRLGTLAGVTVEIDGRSFAVGYEAYEDGERKRISYPTVTVDEARDIHGRLKGVSAGGAPVCADIAYATAELAGAMTLGPIEVSLAYDHRKRPLSRRYHKGGAVLAEVRYAWDAADRLVARQLLHAGARTDHFAHDAGGRLVRAEHGTRLEVGVELDLPPWTVEAKVGGSWWPGDYAREYHYDSDEGTGGSGLDLLEGVAQEVRFGEDPPPFASTREAPDGLLFQTEIDGLERGRDERGNTLRATLWVRDEAAAEPEAVGADLAYDGKDQLVSVVRDDGVTIAYAYRDDGLMVRRELACGTAPNCTPEVTLFVHDGMRLIEEHELTDDMLTLRKRYFYGDESDVPIAADISVAGQLERFYYLGDMLGSVMALADANGDVVERVDYDAWGEPRIQRVDRQRPQIARVVVEGVDAMRVAFSEPVLPPPDLAPGTSLVTTLPSLAGALRLEGPEGAHTIAGVTFVAEHPGHPRGTVVRLVGIQPALVPGTSYELRTTEGALIDSWLNGVTAETVSVDAVDGYVAAIGDTGPSLIARSSVGSPFLFQGEWHDYDTGLVYLRARFYDPSTGLFLSPDPLAYEDSVNPYAGFGHDPVANRDPTGQSVPKTRKPLPRANAGIQAAPRPERVRPRRPTAAELETPAAPSRKAAREATSNGSDVVRDREATKPGRLVSLEDEVTEILTSILTPEIQGRRHGVRRSPSIAAQRNAPLHPEAACAPTCLVDYLRRRGKEIDDFTWEFIEHMAGTSARGTRLRRLEPVARLYGVRATFQSVGTRARDQAFLPQVIAHRRAERVPMLAAWTEGGKNEAIIAIRHPVPDDRFHAILITGFDDTRSFRVRDPSGEEYFRSKDDIAHIWTGDVLWLPGRSP